MSSPAAAPPRTQVVAASAVRPQHHGVARAVAAVVSGLLAYLAFPPVGAWPLAVVAVTVLALAVRGVRPAVGAGLGLLHGLALFLPLVEWVAANAGPLALVLLPLSQALYLAGLGALLAVATRHRGWPLWTAGLWVLEEAVRGRVPFGGFTWGRLAFSQAEGPLLPYSAVGGAPLVSFVVALLGAVLAWAIVQAGARPVRALAAVAAAAVVTPLLAAAVPVPVDGEPVRVALVQGNVPRLGLGFNAQRAAVLDNHVQATRRLAADVRAGRVPAPELVIWPENASDIDPFADPVARRAIDAAVRDVGVPVLVGSLVDAPDGRILNSGIVWDPQTGAGARYVKRHPVPFGEYIPFRSLVRRVTTRVDLVPRDFAAGDTPGVLRVGPVVLGDVICFEVAYDDLVRDVVTGGGQLIVVQTNNATFGRSAETRQQLAMGRLRAVEHGRSVLVAATSGISAVITPDGRLVAEQPVFTRGVLSATVPTRDATTLATRLGAAPELLLAATGLVGLLLAARRRPA